MIQPLTSFHLSHPEGGGKSAEGARNGSTPLSGSAVNRVTFQNSRWGQKGGKTEKQEAGNRLSAPGKDKSNQRGHQSALGKF